MSLPLCQVPRAATSRGATSDRQRPQPRGDSPIGAPTLSHPAGSHQEHAQVLFQPGASQRPWTTATPEWEVGGQCPGAPCL